ncbi:MAG: hypothetical protein MHMPM18_001460 [Marteilia pararefringens]
MQNFRRSVESFRSIVRLIEKSLNRAPQFNDLSKSLAIDKCWNYGAILPAICTVDHLCGSKMLHIRLSEYLAAALLIRFGINYQRSLPIMNPDKSPDFVLSADKKEKIITSLHIFATAAHIAASIPNIEYNRNLSCLQRDLNLSIGSNDSNTIFYQHIISFLMKTISEIIYNRKWSIHFAQIKHFLLEYISLLCESDAKNNSQMLDLLDSLKESNEVFRNEKIFSDFCDELSHIAHFLQQNTSVVESHIRNEFESDLSIID